MEDGESPDCLPAPLTVAVALRGTHSGVAGEVVADKTVLLEPASDPLRVIAGGSRVFQRGFPRHLLESVIVEHDQLFHFLGVVLVDVGTEVIVNPPSVAADFIAAPHELVDEALTG